MRNLIERMKRRKRGLKKLRYKDSCNDAIERDASFQYQLLENIFHILKLKNVLIRIDYRGLEIIRTTKKIALPFPDKDKVLCFTHIRCFINNKGISTHSHTSFVDAKNEFTELVKGEL